MWRKLSRGVGNCYISLENGQRAVCYVVSICFTLSHLVPSVHFFLLHLEYQKFRFTLLCYCSQLRMTCVVTIVTVAAEKQRVAEEVANMLAVSIEVDTNFTQTYGAIHVKQCRTSVIY